MQFREDLLGQLRSCLEKEGEWHGVERCFREALDEDAGKDGRPVVWAFGYMLAGRRREDSRERSGVFAPMIVWKNGASFPPPLVEIQEEAAPIWADYAKATEDYPLAASRFHDLLWVVRFGDRPVDHARAAIDAYLGLGETAETMDLVDCISRALEIASEIGDEDRIAEAVKKAVEVIEVEIADVNERRPGIPMNLLEDLAALKPERQPDNLMDMIEASGKRYGADPWIAQSASELRSSLLPPEERAALAEELVERWRAEAQKGDGLLRYVHLQHALELARKHSLAERAEEILVEVQSITPEELNLKKISAEVKIPREKIDPFVKSFGDQESWEAALERLGAEGPPITAEPSEQSETLLSRIIPTQVIGSRSSLIFGADEEEDHDRLDTSQDDALRIQLWGTFVVEILDTIRNRFGTPDRTALNNFFATELIDASMAARLADALLRFLNGDDDAALHIAVPQIEASIRSTAAHLGIVVIKNPQGERPGGVRPLGALLADLRGRTDEAWRGYFLNALTDSLGLNLRDQVSHGLYGPVSRGDVAIALHIALQLRLWRVTPVRDDSGGDEPPGNSREA
jgi:hypothetical protein